MAIYFVASAILGGGWRTGRGQLTPQANCDLKPEGSIARDAVRTVLSLSTVTVQPACPLGVQLTILVPRIVNSQFDIHADETPFV